MATINVTLTDAMAAWVEKQARSGNYDRAGDYVRDLIRRDQERAAAHLELQQLITEGMDSGLSDRTPEQLLDAARAAARAERATSDL